ncbi:unnamed protein product [Mycena citricolor]|uniref:Uncharacterized protein n=1 Tax=Mycena citricolor TaxID=2018698 RepID=A0AAD2HZA7_9AGAR|nr:unnamed protein product [Mycena citricolor]
MRLAPTFAIQSQCRVERVDHLLPNLRKRATDVARQSSTNGVYVVRVPCERLAYRPVGLQALQPSSSIGRSADV